MSSCAIMYDLNLQHILLCFKVVYKKKDLLMRNELYIFIHCLANHQIHIFFALIDETNGMFIPKNLNKPYVFHYCLANNASCGIPTGPHKTDSYIKMQQKQITYQNRTNLAAKIVCASYESTRQKLSTPL